MEIIIHGKPNAGSAKATSGLDDALAQHIIDEFFQGMSSIKDNESLYVDVLYWKNTWYSIYTYQLGGNIKDTAERVSYFAISMVIPGAYYCLVSEVYKYLKRVCAENVIGTYISKNGKYLVQNFEDINFFNALVGKIDNKDFVNLTESFDTGFRPKEKLDNSICYHVQDCDSKAFVEQLRLCGRIIVSEAAPTKDSIVANANKYKQESQQRGQQVISLQAKVEDLEKRLKEANTSSGSKMKNMEKELQGLKAENSNLKTDKDTLAQKQAGLQKKIDEVASLLGLSRTAVKTEKTYPAKQNADWLKLLPIVNTALLVLLVLLMLSNLADCSGNENEEAEKEMAYEYEGSNFDNRDYRIDDKAESGEAFTDRDKDCGITIFQDKRPINTDDIDLSKEIILSIGNPVDGYAFSTENVVNGQEIEVGKPFRIKQKDSNRPVIITYGSNDENKHNERNIITINPNQ